MSPSLAPTAELTPTVLASQKLEVFWEQRLVLPLEADLRAANSYNYSMRKPTLRDPCGSNAYAAWENKIYVVVCGGLRGVEIRTVDKIVLSLGMDLTRKTVDDTPGFQGT